MRIEADNEPLTNRIKLTPIGFVLFYPTVIQPLGGEREDVVTADKVLETSYPIESADGKNDYFFAPLHNGNDL